MLRHYDILRPVLKVRLCIAACCWLAVRCGLQLGQQNKVLMVCKPSTVPTHPHQLSLQCLIGLCPSSPHVWLLALPLLCPPVACTTVSSVAVDTRRAAGSSLRCLISKIVCCNNWRHAPVPTNKHLSCSTQPRPSIRCDCPHSTAAWSTPIKVGESQTH
jgi:hypothetical protein